MRFGYNTNGFASHRLDDAIEILAEIGYQSVAVTLDHHTLCPLSKTLDDEVSAVRDLLARHEMTCVIETGARFLLDARRKHQPTLISPSHQERRVRLEFLKSAIDIAADLNAEAVSFWSGSLTDDASDDEAWSRLVEGCRALCAYAEPRGVRLAFEPEPGMFVETTDAFARLGQAVDHRRFGLTLDVGHVHCLGDGEPADHIRAQRDCLYNIHIEDMRRGTHDHVPFGTGEMDFKPILRALREIDYTGPVNVELSRHSHDAVRVATESYKFLTNLSNKLM